MATRERRRTGRRPGQSGTRDSIAVTARRQFANLGYEGTTIRGIAKEAGVDPALVHHFFGSKKELFASVTTFPFELEEAMPRIIEGPRSELGRRLAEWALGVLEDPESREAINGIVRAGVSDQGAADASRQLVTAEVLVPIAKGIDADEPELRASLINAQLVGLIVARYIVAVEPLASLPAERVVDAIAPNLQRYLTRPLRPLPSTDRKPRSTD
jgi:AcrR family transcriptional regulator